MADHIRYDLLTQQALRNMLRHVLADAAKKGLPGDHHFYVSFNTQADGVKLSEYLRGQYPEEMTVILQHQFWDLVVDENSFGVGMSFGGVPEKLTIPFDAITGFFDPSVQFGLQFEKATKDLGSKKQETPRAQPASTISPEKSASVRLPTMPLSLTPMPSMSPPMAMPAVEKPKPDPDDPTGPGKGGGKVVRLDRFRKK